MPRWQRMLRLHLENKQKFESNDQNRQHPSVAKMQLVATFETPWVWTYFVSLTLQLSAERRLDNRRDHRTGGFFIHQP